MSDEKPGPEAVTGLDAIWMCTCMQSNDWPFCDGSHHTFGGEGPDEVPLDRNKTYMICRCFRSRNKPFCDGSHAK